MRDFPRIFFWGGEVKSETCVENPCPDILSARRSEKTAGDQPFNLKPLRRDFIPRSPTEFGCTMNRTLPAVGFLAEPVFEESGGLHCVCPFGSSALGRVRQLPATPCITFDRPAFRKSGDGDRPLRIRTCPSVPTSRHQGIKKQGRMNDPNGRPREPCTVAILTPKPAPTTGVGA